MWKKALSTESVFCQALVANIPEVIYLPHKTYILTAKNLYTYHPKVIYFERNQVTIASTLFPFCMLRYGCNLSMTHPSAFIPHPTPQGHPITKQGGHSTRYDYHTPHG